MGLQKIGSYQCIKVVGEGSFGTAILVKDEKGNEHVLKKIDVARLPTFNRTEAINEVKTMAKISSHPFLVKYKEAFIAEQNLCIVMEYCSGGELQSKIKRFQSARSVFSEPALCRWLAQLAVALHFLHKNKLLHRDLKSANIFLDSQNQLRLGDFGLSKLLNHTLAKAKTFCGTPVYMAPEVCKHDSYDSAADIWALGVLMYEIASLHVPFQASNLPALFKKVCNDPTPTIPTRYSKALRKLCASLLNKDPKRRPSALQILGSPLLKEDLKALKKQNTSLQLEFSGL